MPKKPVNKKAIIFIFLALIVLLVAGFLFYKFQVKKEIVLKTEKKTGNINVLILGRGGGTHDGPDLTDTIMLAMINPTKDTVNLVSIPRDLWIPDIVPGESAKINAAFAKGESDNGQGIKYSKSTIEKVTGQHIDYVFVIDFSGFVKLIDHLGGIDVDVKKTLDDYYYPVEGKEDDSCGFSEDEIASLSAQIATSSATEFESFPCRYKHLHVDAGKQHMGGQEALEFVRSRHGINGEGSDFARSQRQQEVIAALKDKALSLGIILNPIKVIGAFNIIKDNIKMTAELSEVDDFINLAQKMQNAKVTSYVIDAGDASKDRYGLLDESPSSPQTNYQFALTPRVGNGNFTEIKKYIECIKLGLICTIEEDGLGMVKEGEITPTPKSKE